MLQHQIRAGFMAALALSAGMGLMVRAQDAPPQGGGRRQGGGSQGGGGQFAGMQRVTGVITVVAGETLTLKTEDGTVQVVTTANTRVMKAQGETQDNATRSTPAAIKVSDLKVGDGLMALGNLDAPNKTLHAAMMFATDAEQVKKLRENLGKTYISGKVTAIDADNLKLTLTRSDGVVQTIGFDDSTSFKRGGRARVQIGATGAPTGGSEGGESITLADIKVGDNVAGTGSVKSGVFVPVQLNVLVQRAPGAGRGPRGGGIGSSGAGVPPAGAPQTPPQ